jgi:hypothetical protein
MGLPIGRLLWRRLAPGDDPFDTATGALQQGGEYLRRGGIGQVAKQIGQDVFPAGPGARTP